MKVFQTQFAEDKLEDVYSYYCEKAGQSIAIKLVNELITKSLELELNPLIGQKESLLVNRIQEFRYLVHKNYKLIYLVNQDKKRIEIINLFDCRQNPQELNKI